MRGRSPVSFHYYKTPTKKYENGPITYFGVITGLPRPYHNIWAHAWEVFRRVRSPGGRSRRAGVDFVVCFGRGGFF